MDVIQAKLTQLGYDLGATKPEAMLYAGHERQKLLKWLLERLLGRALDELGTLKGAADEMTESQRLAEVGHLLGLTGEADDTLLQGSGSYEKRVSALLYLIELVEAASDESAEDNYLRDIELLDEVCRQQASILSTECNLFPPDVPMKATAVIGVDALEEKLRTLTQELGDIRRLVDRAAAQGDCHLEDDVSESDQRLQSQLTTFLQKAGSFTKAYEEDIRHWAESMERPEVHGVGPLAQQVLESYKQISKLLQKCNDCKKAAKLVKPETDMELHQPGLLASPSWTEHFQGIVQSCEQAVLHLDWSLRVLQRRLDNNSNVAPLSCP